MAEPIISVSGLRGVVGQSLTPQVLAGYAAAFAGEAPPGEILIAQDGRETGGWIAQVIAGTLRACGRNTVDLGVVATPTVGVLVKERRSAGAVQISASHNPPEYNGIKLFGSDGRVLPAASGQKVLERYRSGKLAWAIHSQNGRMVACDWDLTQGHWAAIARCVDVERIQGAKFQVLLDSNRGSGSILGQRLLKELGCRTLPLGGTPDGQFEHPPEPTAENLRDVCKRIPQTGSAIGFCQDPDADRLALIDETGRYIGEEYTLAICAKHVLSQRPGPMVINCATSRMCKDIAEELGLPCHVSAVGEANVVDLMLKTNAVLGGEGNGGAIDPRVVLVRDSFVGMALVLDAMAARRLPLSVLADELPRYAIVKDKFSVSADKLTPAFERLIAQFPEAGANRQDGLRLDWPNRWLLVRGSNTEPIVRAIAEAPTPHEAKELCQIAGKILLAT